MSAAKRDANERRSGRAIRDQIDVDESGTPVRPPSCSLLRRRERPDVAHHMARRTEFHCLAPDFPGFGRGNRSPTISQAQMVAVIAEQRLLPGAGVAPVALTPYRQKEGLDMKLKSLVGSGHKIGVFVLPFVIAGLVMNLLFPSLFATPQSPVVTGAGAALLVPGLVVWAWSVILILMEVPKGRLITSGPYALVKHPLYTGVSLLALPGLGFLLGTWLGLLFGVVLYAGSRIFAPEEEKALSETFGADWGVYARSVRMSWL